MNSSDLYWKYNPRTQIIEDYEGWKHQPMIFLTEGQPDILGEFIARAPEIRRLTTYLLDVYRRLNDELSKKSLYVERRAEDLARGILNGPPDTQPEAGWFSDQLADFLATEVKNFPPEKQMSLDWQFDVANSVIRDGEGREIGEVQNASEPERLQYGAIAAAAPVMSKLAYHLIDQIRLGMSEWERDKDDHYIEKLPAVFNLRNELFSAVLRGRDVLSGQEFMPELTIYAVWIAHSGMFIEKDHLDMYSVNLNPDLSGITSPYGLYAEGTRQHYPTQRGAEEIAFKVLERHMAITDVDERIIEAELAGDMPPT